MLRLLLIIYMCVVSLHLVMWNSHKMQDCINKVTFDSWGNNYIATYMIHLHRRLCCSNIQNLFTDTHKHHVKSTFVTIRSVFPFTENPVSNFIDHFWSLHSTTPLYISTLRLWSTPYFELRPLRSENQLPSQVPECRVLKSKGELYLCWGFAVG